MDIVIEHKYRGRCYRTVLAHDNQSSNALLLTISTTAVHLELSAYSGCFVMYGN